MRDKNIQKAFTREINLGTKIVPNKKAYKKAKHKHKDIQN